MGRRACGANSPAGQGLPSLRRKKPSGARAAEPAAQEAKRGSGWRAPRAGGRRRNRATPVLSSLRRTPIDAARCALASIGVRAARARLRRKQKPTRGRTGSRRHSNGNGGTGRTQGRRARAMRGAHPLKASSVRRCRRRTGTPSRARASYQRADRTHMSLCPLVPPSHSCARVLRAPSLRCCAAARQPRAAGAARPCPGPPRRAPQKGGEACAVVCQRRAMV